MKEELKKVLEMLAAGKITAEDADRLLVALGEARLSDLEEKYGGGRPPEPPAAPEPPPAPGSPAEPGGEAPSAMAACPVARHREPVQGELLERPEADLASWISRAIAALGLGEKYTEEKEWTLEGAGVSTISAETSNGAISLDGSDQAQVVVRVRKEVRAHSEAVAREFARQVQVRVERRGDEVRVYKEHPRPPFGINVSVHYEIRAPRAIHARLRTSNGKIRVAGMENAVDVETSNGAVEVQGGGGQIDLRTSNGKITLQDVKGRVRAHTHNGSIEAVVASLEQEGVFSTSNGSIGLRINAGVAPCGSAPITATTSNGSIELALPAGFSGQLDARTSNGRVRSELANLAAEGSRTHLTGQIGAGGEATVKLHTINGSIHIANVKRDA